jgi:hypothetical protein
MKERVTILVVKTGMVTRFELCKELEEMVVGRVQFQSLPDSNKFFYIGVR